MFLITRMFVNNLPRQRRSLMIIRTLTSNNKNSEIFSRIDLEANSIQTIRFELTKNLKISNEKANLILLKWLNDSSVDRNQQQLNDKINLLRSNFDIDDIDHNIQLLNISMEKIQSKINILNELAFKQPEISMLYALPNLMNKNIEQLKSIGYYDENLDLLGYIVQQLRSTNVDQHSFSYDKFEQKLRNEYKNNSQIILKDLRRTIISLILRQILDCSRQVAQHLIDDQDNDSLDNHLDRISLRKLLENLNILKNQLNLPVNFMVKHFHMLCNCDTANLAKLATINHFHHSIDNDSNDLRLAFFCRKRLVNLDAKLIEERMNILLKNYGCTIQQLTCNVLILELSTDKIRENFEKFKKQPELQSYSDSRDLLRIILNIDIAIRNIELLKEKAMQTRYVSLHNLLKPSNRFSTMLANNNFKLTLNTFVQMHFGITLKEIKNRIGKFQSSKTTRSLNSVNAENIVNFFREQGLSDDQIINGIYLVFLDFNLIQTVWSEMFNSDDNGNVDGHQNRNWKQHPNVLQLLFHKIETRNVHH